MKYIVRRTGGWEYRGPYTLGEIQERIPSSIDPADSLVIVAAGQSHQALASSEEWFPIREILADAKPLAPGQPSRVSYYASLRSSLGLLAILSHLIVSFVALRQVLVHAKFVNLNQVFSGIMLGLAGNFAIFALKHVVLLLADISDHQKSLQPPPDKAS